MKEKVYIYFDEFGNAHPDIEKKGSFSHFVYTAILIRESNLADARKMRELISKKYFQGSDIKSNNIKNNDKGFNKRLNILDELKSLNFLVYSFVINKSELKGDGLKYKRTFIKYFQKIFIKKLVDQYSSFEIFADELGHPEFKKSLKEFIDKYAIQRDLFNPDRYYHLVDDFKDEKLVQLADFLSGCVGKIYCISHLHPQSYTLFDKLNDRIFVDFFPFQKLYFYANLPDNHEQIDRDIAMISLGLVQKYLETDWRINPYHSEEVLKHLLLNYKVAPDRMVDTHELVSVIQQIDYKYTEQSLRLAIAHLRDKGLIIVSIQGRYGYKIPNRLDDIYGFFNRYMNSIIPMIKRVDSSNEILKLKSVNEINLMETDDSLRVMRNLIAALDKESTAPNTRS